LYRYATGKATALVVDIGHQQSSVTALWEGMVLKKSKSFIPPIYILCNMTSLFNLTTVDLAILALMSWPLTRL